MHISKNILINHGSTVSSSFVIIYQISSSFIRFHPFNRCVSDSPGHLWSCLWCPAGRRRLVAVLSAPGRVEEFHHWIPMVSGTGEDVRGLLENKHMFKQKRTLWTAFFSLFFCFFGAGVSDLQLGATKHEAS